MSIEKFTPSLRLIKPYVKFSFIRLSIILLSTVLRHAYIIRKPLSYMIVLTFSVKFCNSGILEQSLGKLKQKQVDIQAVEQIVAKPVPLSSKVKLEAQDYQTLVTAARAFVVQEKKERRLDKLLKAAEKTIATLEAKIAEMKQELDSYRSVKGHLKAGSLEKENGELRSRSSRPLTGICGGATPAGNLHSGVV